MILKSVFKKLCLLFSFLILGKVFFYAFLDQSGHTLFLKNDIIRLLQNTNIDGVYADDLELLVKTTQAEWLRSSSKERWELEDGHYTKMRDLFLPVFSRMGFVYECVPVYKNYKYVFFLGATLKGMQARLKTLSDVIDHDGINAEELVVLVGQRSLTEDEKQEAAALWPSVMCTTESDVALQMIQNSDFKGKKNFKKITMIDVAPIQKEDGSVKRPTTEDTIKKWVATYPKSGSILLISSQPFCLYQKVVTESYVPVDCIVDVIGKRSADDTCITVYLDTLARIFYQWNKESKTLNQKYNGHYRLF